MSNDEGQQEWEDDSGEQSPPASPVESDSLPREPASPDNMNPTSPDDQEVYKIAEEADYTTSNSQTANRSVSPDSDEASNNKNVLEESRSSRGASEENSPPRKLNFGDDSDSDLDLTVRKRRASDSDNDEEDEFSEVTPKKKVTISSDEESDDEDRKARNQKNKLLESDDSDDSDGEKRRAEKKDEMMSHIFGDDSDSGEENEYNEEDKEKEGDDEIQEERRHPVMVEGVAMAKPLEGPSEEWDFDAIMKMKKAERKSSRKKRRGDGIDIINDDDGKISAMVEAMKKATADDRAANQERRPAIKKRKMLPAVKQMLLRSEMFEALIENGMMSAVSDWLSPLPDKSLPALEVRTELLKILQDFSRLEQGVLKQSGLGKAVMMLFKHPKETKENKELASKLIRAWSRPIFQLATDFRSVTREERESRDQERMPEIKRRRMSTDAGPSYSKKEELLLKPGDPGYINRARVPRISTKDYVVRPKHSAEMEFKGERKGRAYERLNRAQRDFNERTKSTKIRRAVQGNMYLQDEYKEIFPLVKKRKFWWVIGKMKFAMADETNEEAAITNIFDEESDGEIPQASRSDEGQTSEKIDEEDKPKFESDFDEMMIRKKLQNKRKLKRSSSFDFINDNDNKIRALVSAMNKAAVEDRQANEEKRPAICKLKLLPDVKFTLLKSELFETIIENGMMNCISDWLSPLPDKSLPSMEVRSELLKILKVFPNLNQIILRDSGLGRAIMFLYKHPKEVKSNKEIASKLIRDWSRPIFQLDADFSAVSREERVYRDKARMPEAKKIRMLNSYLLDQSQSPRGDEEETGVSNRDIKRARVPRPSTKDYVLRPKSKVEGLFLGEKKGRTFERIDLVRREFTKRTMANKYQRSTPVSIKGDKLPI